MIATIIAAALVFVFWISYKGFTDIFPFLADYLVYINWAVIGLEAFLAVTFIIFVIAKIRRSFRRR